MLFQAGSYDFGFINETFADSLTYTAVTKLPGYWKFTSTGYGVGDDYTTQSIVGIADTGTTLIYLPAAIVKAYYAEVSGATNSVIFGGYIFDCDADLPDFSFGVGSSVITVPSSYINFETIIGNKCYGGIQSSAGIGINIFGDVALKAAYVVFNADTPSLGWAQKV